MRLILIFIQLYTLVHKIIYQLNEIFKEIILLFNLLKSVPNDSRDYAYETVPKF